MSWRNYKPGMANPQNSDTIHHRVKFNSSDGRLTGYLRNLATGTAQIEVFEKRKNKITGRHDSFIYTVDESQIESIDL